MSTTTFPGRFSSLAKISEFVAKATQKAGLNENTAYAVLVAVNEACANIIRHAYGGEGRGEIECACEVTDENLTVILRDCGDPFDPTNIPEPDFNVPIHELELGGAGLIMMHKIMDEVHFTTTPDGENVLTMIKRKSSPDED